MLDAGEALFAQSGYDGVSMRDVAEQAGIRLGLLTYHYATKDLLFECIVERRASALNFARLTRLDALDTFRLEDVLDAFLRPLLERLQTAEVGWHDYARLILHISQDARWQALSGKHFGAVGHAMIARLRDSEPRLSQDAAVRGYVYLISVMMGVFASTGFLDRFSNGTLSSDDVATEYASMVIFAAAGIRSLATV